MHVVIEFYEWTYRILSWGQFLLWAWAIADCLVRRPAAFHAAGKLTKPAWFAILALTMLFGTLWTNPFTWDVIDPVTFLPLLASCAAGVYLADVRPALREVLGRR